MKLNWHHSLLFLLLVFGLVGCVSDRAVVRAQWSPLEGQIRAVQFTPFHPPRGGDGAGTIVAFNWRGEESRLAASDQCLISSANPVKRLDVGVLSGSYTITNAGGIELDLGRVLDPYLKLDAALS